MIVRESPHKKSIAPQPSWPPKSPYQALISSPSGRKKVEERKLGLGRRSVSPSPIKASPSKPGPLSLPSDDEEDDEDEETLQLKLQAIEAKLKLKKLQQAKAKQSTSAESSTTGLGDPFGSNGRSIGERKPQARAISPEPRSTVQVPLSPIRTTRAPQPKSPARVLLGIDKGLRAQDVSLKRAASTVARKGVDTAPPERIKSFSERIAEARHQEKQNEEKHNRIKQARSTGFIRPSPGLHQTEDRHAFSDALQSVSSRATPLRGQSQDQGTSLGRSATRARQPPKKEPTPPAVLSKPLCPLPDADSSSRPTSAGSDLSKAKSSTLESFSGLHLSQRRISHTDLTRTLEGKALYTLPQLLKVVKSPDYEPPEDESDYVVFGIIAQKSKSFDTKRANTTHSSTAQGNKLSYDDDPESARTKFMVIKLVDLKWEVDLFLFDTGFEQFWKLSVGTVVALLNPSIMPPKPELKDTGRFSLKLASSEDVVLEIGTARDLGFCESVKKNGEKCNAWVNTNKTQHCEFHINLVVEKARSSRMEVNTMVGFGRGRGSSRGRGNWRSGSPEATGHGLLPANGERFDRETKSAYYMAQTGRKSTAVLLDEEGFGMDAADRGMSKKDLKEKRERERDKEMELAKQLGAMGRGMGAEYLRRRTEQKPVTSKPGTTSGTLRPSTIPTGTSSAAPVDAKTLGLMGNKASDVTFNPTKRKFGQRTTSNDAVGWGGAYKTGLPGVKRAEEKPALHSTIEPQLKKKARYWLDDKGIREPGRESLGNPEVKKRLAFDDDDDDLDIV